MNRLIIWLGLSVALFIQTVHAAPADFISASPMQYHKVTLQWNGPNLTEAAATFNDYRLNVLFTSPSNKTYLVPGYFAADGNAANSSATQGNKWRAHINPQESGTWSYSVSFRTGTNLAISLNAGAGNAVSNSFDGSSGNFFVATTNKSANGRDFRGKGKLQYVGERYLRFSNGEYFLKVGPNSPEAFLQYEDFDNTNSSRRYSTHIPDWNAGDAVWKTDKGKGIVGAVNYIASQGMNVHYFLTMNVQGDGKQAFPFVQSEGPTVYDVSKLAQWQVVFDHMMSQGVMTHFVLTEQENQNYFEHLAGLGAVAFANTRKLYYREMVARFGYLNAITWNIGEENGWQTSSTTFGLANTDQERIDYAKYLDDINPYNDHLVVHNQPAINDIYDNLYEDGPTSYNGASYQIAIGNSQLRNRLKTILTDSASAGKQWVVAYDEAFTSQEFPNISDFRNDVIWSTLMLGGAGVEFYIGRKDLVVEDYRRYSDYWGALRYAQRFFVVNDIPFWAMQEADDLTDRGFVLANVGNTYVVHLPAGGSPNLTISGSDTYQVQWYNPRTGGNLQQGSVGSVTGGGARSLGNAPSDSGDEWVVLVRRSTGGGNLRPSVSISSPTDGAVFTQGDQVSVTAIASDFDGSVTKVEFFLDGNQVGSADTVSPYTVSFSAGAPKTYTLSVVATDDDDDTSIATSSIIVRAPIPLRDSDVPANAIEPGVAYDYFKFADLNALNSVNDLAGTPNGSGFLASGPSLAPADADDNNFNNYGFIYTGYVSVLQDGIYTFFTTSNDGSDLFIGDAKVVDNDGQHAALEKSGEIGLKAGLHAITVRYFQSGGSTAFSLAWQGPGISKQTIPSSAWQRENDQPAGNLPPTISLITPTNGSDFTLGDNVMLRANPNDADGSVVQVEFFIDGNSIGVISSPPYNFNWPASQLGSYTASAQATDNGGLKTSSMVASFNVNQAGDDGGGGTPPSDSDEVCVPIKTTSGATALICL